MAAASLLRPDSYEPEICYRSWLSHWILRLMLRKSHGNHFCTSGPMCQKSVNLVTRRVSNSKMTSHTQIFSFAQPLVILHFAKKKYLQINSLVPGRTECDSKNGIFNLVLPCLLIGIFRYSHDSALRWMPQDLTDDKSTLVQVMAWCHQATSHYLSQCWLSLLSPYGIIRPWWVKRKCCKNPLAWLSVLLVLDLGAMGYIESWLNPGVCFSLCFNQIIWPNHEIYTIIIINKSAGEIRTVLNCYIKWLQCWSLIPADCVVSGNSAIYHMTSITAA